MAAEFRVTLAAPQHGWMEFTLRSGEQELVILMSYVPFDSVTELAGALVGVLETNRDHVARINCEPDEFDVRFTRMEDVLRIEVTHFPFSRRRPAANLEFVHKGPLIQVYRCFWRAFRALAARFDRAHWAYDFPSALVERLGELTNHSQCV